MSPIPNNKLPKLKDDVVRVPQVPTPLLIENAVNEAGLPRRIAMRFLDSPELYLQLTLFYWDCGLAAEGDPDAALRVAACRESVQAMRAAERSLGNDPETGPAGPIRGRVGLPEPVVRGAVQAPLRGPQTPDKRTLRELSEKSRAPKYIVLPDGEQRLIK